jgi:hypothetical protein
MFKIATLELNMKLIKVAVLSSLVLVANSCTVLGFATDIVVLSAVTGGNDVDVGQQELFFTKEGIKHDAKLVKELVAELSSSKNDLNPILPIFEEKGQATALMCKNVQDGQQQCYPPEYYKDMYITDSASKEDETHSGKD